MHVQDIRMDREVLAPLNEWLLQYEKMLVGPSLSRLLQCCTAVSGP